MNVQMTRDMSLLSVPGTLYERKTIEGVQAFTEHQIWVEQCGVRSGRELNVCFKDCVCEILRETKGLICSICGS